MPRQYGGGGGGAVITWPLTSSGDMGFQPDGVANNALSLQNAAGAATGLQIQGGTGAGQSVTVNTVSAATNDVGLRINIKGNGTLTVVNTGTSGAIWLGGVKGSAQQ